MFPQASARTRSVYGTTCWRRESCTCLQQIPLRSGAKKNAASKTATGAEGAAGRQLPSACAKFKQSCKTTVSLDCFKQWFKCLSMIVREKRGAAPEVSEEKTRDKILSAAGEVFAEQ